MKSWCVYSLFVKQCLRSVNHEQFPIHMTQNSKHNKCLEFLTGEDFPPKLLWGRPTKIYREQRRRQQQETAKKRGHRLSQRRQRRQHSEHKHVQRQRQNTTIILQAKPMKRGNTNCRRFKKRWGTIQSKLSSYAAIGSKSSSICTMCVKNTFPTYWGQPISLYTMSNNAFYTKLYFKMNSLEHR